MTASSKKQINAIVIAMSVTLIVYFLYPVATKILLSIRSHTYVYGYNLPKNLVLGEISKLPPAQSVPILMYHGVINSGSLGPNTSRKNFILQMEGLKRNGFTTISVREYEQFVKGNLVLPRKPVIITFDDGRKDSYYTVDEVFKKLNFKATIFIATTKANINEAFYLSWDEMKQLQATNRWEIEAHGQRSHDEILIDKNGTMGTYLTSLMYIPGKGLESIEEFKKRVKTDYENGIKDLKDNLNIDAKYYAIPLNDYGDIEQSNYDGAFEYNNLLTRKFFKFAFLQVEQKDGVALESFYNYKDSNPFALKRLEVKNISSEDLIKTLERFAPSKPNLMFTNSEEVEKISKDIQILYGNISKSDGITLVSSSDVQSARLLIGSVGWRNYSAKVNFKREIGRSVSILIYYNDENNFISLDWSGDSLLLIERINGLDQELASYYPLNKTQEAEIYLEIKDGHLSAFFNNISLTKGTTVKLSRGALGFGVWDPTGAQSTIKKLKITSFDK